MFNNCTLAGNLVRDVESHTFDSGHTVATMTIAVNGYKEDDVLFMKVKVWGKTGEACVNNLAKGSKVLVNGELKMENWETNTGEKRTNIILNARQVKFIDSRGAKVENGGLTEREKAAPPPVIDVAELPF
jgi:single-strand DNA-binding protein